MNVTIMVSTSLDLRSWGVSACLLTGLAAASLAWCLISTAAAWFRLRHFPGPFLASFSYLWGVRAMASAQMHRVLTGVQRRYGPIVRIGPNELLIYDAETLWRINGARSSYGRGGWYSTMRMDPYGNSIFSEPDTAKHDKRKAMLAGGYAGRGHMDLERDVNSQVEILVELLRSKYVCNDGTKVLDFGLIARFFTVDVTTLVGLGKAWGDLVNERDTYNYLAAGEAFAPFMFCISMAPLLRQFFASSFFLRLAGPKPTDKAGLGIVLGVTKKEVEERFSGCPKTEHQHETMLDTWIKNGVTSRECELDLNLLLPAGAETVTTVIRGTFLYILATPVVYHKLKREIAEGIHRGRISSPITNEEAKNLPYLQAVINEGIRMVPPLITGFPKRVPPEGDVIYEKFVPGGTDIFVNMYSLLRNKDVFGEDADIFRPERFLECDQDRKALLLKHVDLVFGYGRWTCAGRTLAWIELNKIFVELLRRFDFQLVDPEKPWSTKAYAAWYIDNFLVRVMDGNLG